MAQLHLPLGLNRLFVTSDWRKQTAIFISCQTFPAILPHEQSFFPYHVFHCAFVLRSQSSARRRLCCIRQYVWRLCEGQLRWWKPLCFVARLMYVASNLPDVCSALFCLLIPICKMNNRCLVAQASVAIYPLSRVLKIWLWNKSCMFCTE